MSEKIRVFIGSPCYKWPCEHHMAQSVQAMMADARFDCDFAAVVGDAHIERARASVLAEYLEYKKDWDFFLNVDWDIEFRPDDVYRMCQYNKPVIGGPYTFRSDREDKDKQIVFRNIQGEEPDENYLLKCQYVAGGFMLVKDDFFREMMKRYKRLSFWENPDMHDPPRKTYALWNPILIKRPDWGRGKREILSEDYSFCQRVLDMGTPIYMDLRTLLTHWQDGFPWKLNTNEIKEIVEDDDDDDSCA
jgi:hypothetical protein